MDQRSLQRLEFHKIIAGLQACTTFELGREKAGAVRPVTDRARIERGLSETTEAAEILRCEPELPIGGLRDIRKYLRKAAIGGVLEPSDLLETADMLFAMRRLKTFFRDRTDRYPVIGGLTAGLPMLRELEDRIKESIEPGGDVADTASPELRRIRQRIRDSQAAIKEKMDNLIRSADFQKYLQESIVTVRGGRYVLPVRQEYRAQVPGIIHDQSASGATLFIEPMPVVEKSNELRRLAAEEQQEILRILTQLSAMIQARHDEILTGVEAAGEIDFILAKGKLSRQMNGGAARLCHGQRFSFKGARHPLLKARAVPINVRIGSEFGILVITGPNTGGKTVALKTVGLMLLMTQSGLHIPAEDGSETGVFSQVFADIGDEQSIEQSLSTFSSHMTNIINILNEVDQTSLVLLDELGAGTDPTEGAALAMAILDFLEKKQVRTIATTHYSELKAFAFNRPGIENASVEFDITTLQPTYRLNIGQPGSSSAFEIAARLGLGQEIVEKARQALSQEDIKVTDLIRELEDNRRVSENNRQETDRLRKEVQRLKDQYERKLGEISEKRSEVMEKARREATEFLRQARLEADALLKEIKEAQAQGAERQALAAAQRARSELRKITMPEKSDPEPVTAGNIPREVHPGQELWLPRYNQQAQAVTASENGMVTVQVGAIKMTVELSELRVTQHKKAAETGAPKIMAGKAREISTELDLRGMLVDEALEAAEKYLDDAYLAGLPKAYLIHGKGTGALRKAITSLLAGHRFVKHYRLGDYGEGGAGVTVVELQ